MENKTIFRGRGREIISLKKEKEKKLPNEMEVDSSRV